MSTDINRLHDVALGKLKHRGCGKTTLDCHILVGIMEVTEGDSIICLVKNMRILQCTILPVLFKVLEEHDITDWKLHIIGNKIVTPKVTIKFVVEKRPEMVQGFDGPMMLTHELSMFDFKEPNYYKTIDIPSVSRFPDKSTGYQIKMPKFWI